jgi:hypothetical protein
LALWHVIVASAPPAPPRRYWKLLPSAPTWPT